MLRSLRRPDGHGRRCDAFLKWRPLRPLDKGESVPVDSGQLLAMLGENLFLFLPLGCHGQIDLRGRQLTAGVPRERTFRKGKNTEELPFYRKFRLGG